MLVVGCILLQILPVIWIKSSKLPSGNSRNGVQTLGLSASTTHLQRAGMQLLGRANLHKNCAKLYKKRNQKKIAMENLRIRVLLTAIEQTMAGKGRPRGQQGNGSLCENKETLPGRQTRSRSRPRTRAAAHLPHIPLPQLPPPTVSHVPSHQLPSLASHSTALVVLTRLDRERRTSFTCDRRLPTASQEPVWRPG